VVGKVKADTAPLQKQALELLDITIDDFIDTRAREGNKISTMLKERCDAIEKIVAQVKMLRPQTNERQREKLIARIEALNVEHDTNRLEQELVFVAQRLDVEEELDRLDAHVSELRDVLTRSEPVGRRLDFLVQEFNREANTLGSKSADAQTTALAVDLKVLIETMFLVLLKFSNNKSQASEFMNGHNQWLKRGFDDSVFLMAGSLAEGQGGMVMADNTSLPDLKTRVDTDPFVVEDVVTAEIIQVEPKKVDEKLAFLMDS